MLSTESLFLLLTTPKGESEAWSNHRDLGLAAALLGDLSETGWLDYGVGEDPGVRAVSRGPRGESTPGGPVLAFGVAALRTHPGLAASEVISAPWFTPTGVVVEALASRGVIAPETGRFFGLLPARYPIADPRPEAELRERLAAVLRRDLPATPRTAALLVTLRELGMAHRVLTPGEFTGTEKELEERIGEVVARMHTDDPPTAALTNAMRSLQDLLASTAVLHF